MYNVMIIGFMYSYDGCFVVSMFCEMKCEGFRLDNFIFVSVFVGLVYVVEEEKECV